MTRPTLLLTLTALVVGCARPPAAAPEVEAPATPEMATEHESETIKVTGTIAGSGVATGKSMAAWSGFDLGEPYLQLTLDADQAQPGGTPDTVFLRLSAAEVVELDVGQRVRVEGRWLPPREIAVADPGQPIEMQMPVTLDPAGDEGWMMAPPEAIFEVEAWEPAP